MNKNPKERTEYIGIRVTPEEKAAIVRLAKAAGVTITGYIVGKAIGETIGDAMGDMITSGMNKKKSKTESEQ